MHCTILGIGSQRPRSTETHYPSSVHGYVGSTKRVDSCTEGGDLETGYLFSLKSQQAADKSHTPFHMTRFKHLIDTCLTDHPVYYLETGDYLSVGLSQELIGWMN